MTFVHNDPEFPVLLRIVAGPRQIPVALVEKDNWVTHTLRSASLQWNTEMGMRQTDLHPCHLTGSTVSTCV